MSGAFRGLENSLQVLYMRYNEIEELPQALFQNLTQLRELQLSHNKLHELQKGQFSGMTLLNDLRLEANQLHELREDAFVGMTSLVKLDLTRNKLKSLPNKLFADQSDSLGVLAIGQNNLTDVPSNALKKLERLWDLHLFRNQIKKGDYNLKNIFFL